MSSLPIIETSTIVQASDALVGLERKVKQESAEAPAILDKKAILELFTTSQGPETWEIRPPVFSEEELIPLVESLATNTRIKELCIAKIAMDTEMCKTLGKALEQNQTLKSLKLDRNKITLTGIALIVPGLASNRTLINLEINEQRFFEEGIVKLATIFEENTTLTSLTIAANSIGAEGAHYLCDKLRDNKSLKKLAIYNEDFDVLSSESPITKTGSESIVDLLECNNTITELSIANCNINFDIIFAALHTNKNILTFSMPYHNLKLEVKSICDMLSKNKTLTALSLACMDTKKHLIMESLRFNHTLTSLDLGLIELNPEIAEKILKELEHNRALKEINLQGCYCYNSKPELIATPAATQSLIKDTLQRNTETNKLQERLAFVSGFHSRLGEGTAVYNMSKDPVFERRCLIPIFQFLGCETLSQRKFLDTSPKALPAPGPAAALEDADDTAPAAKSLLFSTIHNGSDKAEPVKNDPKSDSDKSERAAP